MSKKELMKQIAEYTLEWCISKFGPSKFQKGYPTIIYKTKSLDSNEIAYFDEEINKIIVYLTRLETETPDELTDTIVHEYTHYLQDIKNGYNKLPDSIYYDVTKNPYEIEAYKTANKFKGQALNYAVKKLKKNLDS